MKRAPYPQIEDLSGKRQWRSLSELEGSAEFTEATLREFPAGASELPSGIARRSFLGVMGASIALAGLAGCRRPEEKIYPYSRPPEEVIPGRPLQFATATTWMGTGVGLLVESHEGRPTKIEGNPKHPESLGKTNQFLQASVLELYDPDRSRHPRERGQQRSWDDATTALRALGDRFRKEQGTGLAILTDGHRSPTVAAGLKRLQQAMPNAKVYRYEPFSRDAAHEGAKLAFGRPHEAVLDLAQASVIVSLDADVLGYEGSQVKQALGFSAGRDVEKRGADGLSRLYVIESAFSLTGASADHRLRMKSADVGRFALALAAELAQAHTVDLGDLTGAAAQASGALDEKGKKWVRAVAKDLAQPQNRGKGVVIAGRKQPAVVHAIAAAINVALGNAGKTVRYVPVFDEAKEGPEAIAELTKAMRDRAVKALVILGGNPAFNAPGDLGFADALRSVETSVHLASHLDETGASSTWHLNRAHDLESWGDVRSEDGTLSIVQPLIAPLFGGRTDAEVIELLSGGEQKAYDLVRATWKETNTAGTAATDFEKTWRRALHDGSVANSAAAPVEPAVTAAAIAQAARALLKPEAAPAAGLEVTFSPDPHAFDGRFANNGWLQETPDGMHKLTWGNVAALSPKTAEKLGVKDGDLLAVKVGGAEITLPALIAPGQADDSIALTVGQGRREGGTVAKGIGVDTNPLRRTTGFDFAGGAEARAAGGFEKLARTQEHFVMEGRPLARDVTAAVFTKDPQVVKNQVKHLPLLDLWQPYRYDGHKWGMTIDLNKCIACNACTVACQAENNIPVVGKEGVLLSREMHWIRIDRYFAGPVEDPEALAQPMTCQHCETAPCEEVCPVGATTHSPEGLNEMTYNRCIGTKYCGNNCPFKVRRFNFFEYSHDIPETKKAQFNPDVSIRSRGVMEKCTFCVQRINTAKIDAKRDGRDRVRDGEIVTACQQACPADAIHFGDLNDGGSEVAKRAGSARSYHVLAELNIRPRVSYLARIRNPNPELESA